MSIDFIKELLFSPFGSFASVFSLFAVAFWLVHYITKKTTQINTSHRILKESVAKVESNIDEIRRDIAFIKGSFDAAISIKDSITKKRSPITLTELGKEISESNNIDAMIDSNWNKIKSLLNGLKTKNPYDIQQYCVEETFIEPKKFFTDNDIDKLKVIAYKSGLPLLSVTRLAGVLIRDRYFEENGIDVESVDRHDPNVTQTLK